VNTRRHVLVVLGAAAVAPRAVLAQSKQAPVLIGWTTGIPTSHDGSQRGG